MKMKLFLQSVRISISRSRAEVYINGSVSEKKNNAGT
jgi:hypothetical protein